MPKLALFSNDRPDCFVIDHDGLVDIDEIETDADRRNATLEWTEPHLRVGETGMLVRAISPLGFCLRIAPFDHFRIHSKFFEGIIDPQVAKEVREESTFTMEEAEIDPNHVSFRSVKFPNRFIRHRGKALFAEPVNTPQELQSACFRFHRPLAQE